LLSAFAGNPLLISPERLLEDDLLATADLEDAPLGPEDRVDYGAVVPWKERLLRASYARYERIASAALRAEFAAFCAAISFTLPDLGTFPLKAMRFTSGKRSTKLERVLSLILSGRE
jgi:4-alpha-glucanotransferase